MRALMAVLGGLGVLGAVAWMGAAPAGAHAPSVEAGGEVAARWCAACHVVSRSGAGGDSGPSFTEIALRSSAEQTRLFLARPHAKPMRGFSLNSREIGDVAAYIESLQTPR